MASAIQSREDHLSDYESEHVEEACECFNKLCKFNAEQICKCVAWAYLEDDLDAQKAWNDLGLTRRHAMIVCGRRDDFWYEIKETRSHNNY